MEAGISGKGKVERGARGMVSRGRGLKGLDEESTRESRRAKGSGREGVMGVNEDTPWHGVKASGRRDWISS